MNDELFFFWRTPVCPTIPSHTYVRKRRARVSFDVRICVRSRTRYGNMQRAVIVPLEANARALQQVLYTIRQHTHTQHLSCTIYVCTLTHTHTPFRQRRIAWESHTESNDDDDVDH